MLDEKIAHIIEKMTVEDKIALCSGADVWHSKAMKKYGIPSFMMADGPHGLRYQKGDGNIMGVNTSEPSTCFPAAALSGCSWDESLLADEARAIGHEASSFGVDILLGPGVNIKRNPLCGRNFEYFSEDPLLAGRLATAWINGAQAAGVGTSLKHFAANNQEYKRFNGNSQVDMRALREIYFPAFETAVKKAKPATVMCAYPKLNGVHCSDNTWLLTDVLRDEWGFDGLVVTDWGAMSDRIKAMKAGCDLSMPGGSSYQEKELLEAVLCKDLEKSAIDACVSRIIKLAFERANKEKKAVSFDVDKHHFLAQKIAEQSAVLMKNDDNLLPLDASDLVLIGHMADNMRYQGAGSSHINPTKLISLKDALPNAPYLACCDKDGSVTSADLHAAATAAKATRVALVCAGLPDIFESEGFDRDNMSLPDGHNKMINAVVDANPNTVVVLFAGSVVEMPWFDKVKAVIYMGLLGQAGGQAIANLLLGKACFSGKLTETWPLSYEDVISRDTFGKKTTRYKESIYVGYRYYDKAKVPVCLTFGHGLSYTTFSYSDLTVDRHKVTAIVKNTGKIAGKEIVQLYIGAPQDGLHRPIKELKGFAKVALAPGEKKQVAFTLNDRCFALWSDGWKIQAGTYTLMLGASCADIRLTGTLDVKGQTIPAFDWQKGCWYESMRGQPTDREFLAVYGGSFQQDEPLKKGSFTMENTILEMQDVSFVMRLTYRVFEKTIAKNFGGKIDYNDPAFKMTMLTGTDAPMRLLIICANDRMPEPLAQALLEMANGHIIRGLKKAIAVAIQRKKSSTA